MKANYHEEAYATRINPWKSEILKTPSEGDVTLKVKNRVTGKDSTLEGFLSGHDELTNWLNVEKGDRVLVRLVLLNWEYNAAQRTSSREKAINQLKSYEYQINGEIVEIDTHPDYNDSLRVILDCGIYFETRLGKNIGLKVGDYMRAEGRLDAHIIGKA